VTTQIDPPPASRTDATVGQAIEVLTALARQTRVRGEGTPSAAVEPVDFADITAQVLTAVAANLGGVETLLAGRPGSWEADLVRQLVNGTAGYRPDDLLSWRTEPVRLEFDADDVFYDFGISDLYEQERERAVERTFDDLPDEQLTAAEALAASIERLWEQDQAAYAQAYLATAQRYLTERGATCGVELVAVPRTGDPTKWDELAEQVHDYAREHTPLPMTGSTPDVTEGTPADALRRAGLTYTARAATPRL
jgi:hypothetical protein